MRRVGRGRLTLRARHPIDTAALGPGLVSPSID
jgi:hypothetical protein